MRCESKNRDFKIYSRASGSRLNICKTLAISAQLRLNHRLQQQCSVDDKMFEITRSRSLQIKELTNSHMFSQKLPFNIYQNVIVIQQVIFHGKTLEENTVLAVPNEMRHEFFVIQVILEDVSRTLYVVVRNVTDYTYYDEHYQGYRLHENYASDPNIWQCSRMTDFEDCSVTRIACTTDGRKFILKRWI